ncbi:MAG: peptide-methionine (R)-S-oxide reductase MsrB [Patescibacteria group bacterium]
MNDLTDDQKRILIDGGTEAPGSGDLLHNKTDGSYACAACDNVLFESGTKFDSGSGWPSFYDAIPGSVELLTDDSHGMIRTEVRCSVCEGHLGHVFNDAHDQPGGKRYCINSLAMCFNPKESND